jgi:hypothetical protein
MIAFLHAFLLSLAFLAVGVTIQVIAAMVPPRGEGGLARRFAAVGLGSTSLVLPFVLPAPSVLRALVAQALSIAMFRLIEIARTPARFPPRERALRIVLFPYEFTFLERIPRRWPVRDMALSTLLLVVGTVGLVLSGSLGPVVAPYDPAGWPRWLGATVAAYVMMEGMTWQWTGILPAFGFKHRKYQRHPILSRTIAEFWGVRWSTVVHRWLRSNAYEPLARRRFPRAGVVLAFTASALLHAYMVWPAAGIVPALWMLAFFLAHGFFLIVEARLGVRRWPPIGGRAFTLGVFLVTVPLFMEPILRTLGV